MLLLKDIDGILHCHVLSEIMALISFTLRFLKVFEWTGSIFFFIRFEVCYNLITQSCNFAIIILLNVIL